MTIAPYRVVLALPGVTRLLAFAVLARVPMAAMSIVLTLHVVTGLDRGYGAAGLVVGLLTVGSAIGAPWRGRAVDRFGLRRALLPSVVVEGVVWTIAPFLDYRSLLVAVFFGGLLGLPIFSVVRQSLAVLVPVRHQRPAFALDSMSVELTFMLGPPAGVLIATTVSTAAGLLAIGVSMVVAGLCLMALNPPTRSDVVPAEIAAPVRSSWWNPAWLGRRQAAVLAATAGALVVLGGSEVAVVAVLRAAGSVELSAAVFVAWSVASLAGGLVFGALQRPVSPFLLLLVMSVLTLPIGLADSPWLLALAILPAGALCAPVLSATASAISRLVPEEVRGEANGWYGSATTAGLALGAPLAGAAVDRFGGWSGFVAVGLFGVVVGITGLLLPDRDGALSGAEAAQDAPGGHIAVV